MPPDHSQKRILIIAGPNGAGKTTFARALMIFLSLKSPEHAIARVALRVKQGGHDIPEGVIRRRFHAGIANFRNVYAELVDAWVLYDNSDSRFTMLEWSDSR